MKKIFALFTTLFLLLVATNSEIQAQNQSNPDFNPCFSIQNNGPCVCFGNGKLRAWLAIGLIAEAKPGMETEFPNYSFSDYLKAYYRTEALDISYLGGSWEEGQTFRVAMGNCVIIVISDGGL